MKTQNESEKNLQSQWQFDLAQEPLAPYTRIAENELERLKNRLLREALASVATPTVASGVRRAANEAAALAWLESDPLLVFPALFQEKLLSAKRHAQKQLRVQARSEGLLATVG